MSRKLAIGTRCYLCGNPILTESAADRDHIPAKSYFPKQIRTQFNPNLDWRWTHKACNGPFAGDEQYFIASIGPMTQNAIGDAIRHDLREAYLKHPEQMHLGKMVLGEFSDIELPGGLVAKKVDGKRIDKVLWKIVRGLNFMETGIILPADLPHTTKLYPTPEEVQRNLIPGGWFPAVRDTEPMGRYGAIIEHKVIGWVDFDDRGTRQSAQIWALLLWHHVIAVVIFHNPDCRCAQCTLPTEAKSVASGTP